ncbi:hypothetical protein J3E72DRAFT_380148 [Bipolaris maydis]|nr:hypothetical protein J3E72DRAFT_380148 [Bipolaris maydis]
MAIEPFSLLELGLWAGSGKVVVCCGDEYWKGIEEMLFEKGMVLDDKRNLMEENVYVEKEKPKKKAQLEGEKTDLQRHIEELQG